MNDYSIYDNLGCPVLAKNMQIAADYNLADSGHFLEMLSEAQTDDISDILKAVPQDEANALFTGINNLPYYDENFEGLSSRYQFPSEALPYCKDILNMAGHIYLAHMGKVWIKPVLKNIEADLEKLMSNADRLSFPLNVFLRYGEGIDIFFGFQPVHQILIDTQKNIEAINSFKDKFRSSISSTASNLGKVTPLGNQGLPEFIKLSWLLWHEILGRTLEQKYDGKNGRKQFLGFLMDGLKPIHPALEYDTVDNALKKFQKQIRIKGSPFEID